MRPRLEYTKSRFTEVSPLNCSSGWTEIGQFPKLMVEKVGDPLAFKHLNLPSFSTLITRRNRFYGTGILAFLRVFMLWLALFIVLAEVDLGIYSL